MAIIKEKLPPYCVVRRRKNCEVVYFHVPARLCPPGWKTVREVGRTDRHSFAQIVAAGKAFYEELQAARNEGGTPAATFVRTGSLSWVIARYKQTEHWTGLRPETQRSYKSFLDTIRKWSKAAGHPHVSRLTPVGITAFLNRWADKPRTRKFYKAVLSKLCFVAVEEGLIPSNPVSKIVLPKSHRRVRRVRLWKEKDIDTFAAQADAMGLANVGTAVVLAWEGFRQTDILRLQEPRDYRGGKFVFETSKTGETVSVRASERTVRRLATRPKTQLLLTVNDFSGAKWTKNSFLKMFEKVRTACGLEGYGFRHIRNSKAIECLRADLTDAEFRQRFGWAKKDVEAMRSLYTDIDQEILDSGADKLEAFERKRKKSNAF